MKQSRTVNVKKTRICTVGDGYNVIMYNRDEYVLCIKEYVTFLFFFFHVKGGERIGGCNVVFGAEEHAKRWSGQNMISKKIEWPV